MKKNYYIVVLVMVVVAGFLFWQFGFKQTPLKNSPALSLSYPQNLKVTETTIEGIDNAKRILVESGEPKKGFEMVILPFDETGLLTAERIKQDVPDMVMNNIKSILVSDSIKGVSFDSTDENIGKTFEIWFVYDGYLYQALTYPEFGPQMEEILKTWKFK